MFTTVSSPTPFAYVECDVPAGQTLVEWRRERVLERRADRPQRRFPSILRPRFA